MNFVAPFVEKRPLLIQCLLVARSAAGVSSARIGRAREIMDHGLRRGGGVWGEVGSVRSYRDQKFAYNVSENQD